MLIPIPGLDTVAGDAVPRRGNALTRAIGRLLLKLGGWRIEGQLPNLSKFVIAGAPHTSNWDAVWALAFIFATGLDIRWMAKRELFDNPFGGVLRRMGGIPVDRQAPQGIVRQVIDQIERGEQGVLVITPEGTRKKVERWKTGFYRIAQGASAPIVLGYLDYPRRVVGIGPVVQPSGDVDADIEAMRSFFRTVTPRHPEQT